MDAPQTVTYKRTRRGGRGRVRRRGKHHLTAPQHAWQRDGELQLVAENIRLVSEGDTSAASSSSGSGSYQILPNVANYKAPTSSPRRPERFELKSTSFHNASLTKSRSRSSSFGDSDDESVCSRMTAMSFSSSATGYSAASSCASGRWWKAASRVPLNSFEADDDDSWRTPFDQKASVCRFGELVKAAQSPWSKSLDLAHLAGIGKAVAEEAIRAAQSDQTPTAVTAQTAETTVDPAVAQPTLLRT